MKEQLPELEHLHEYHAIHQTFRNSEYGRTLENNVRFTDFKPESTPNELWQSLLGDDVNNLRHMTYTYELARDFCIGEGMTYEDTSKLLLVAITHDWGEAIVGDIALPSKTVADESKEQMAYLKIAEDLFGQEEGSNIAAEVLPILYKHDPELGDKFRAIEYIGYCKTAMRAGHVANLIAHGFLETGLERKDKEQLMGGLLALQKAVEVRNYPVLSEYIKKYPSIREMMC